MLTGLNHLTLAVKALPRSLAFYHQLLELRLHARWQNGAYLSCGDLWLCLSVDPARESFSPTMSDYTHYAFSIAPENFDKLVTRLKQHGVAMWKTNSSEGDSYYFLDPDGHRLEIHVGDLAQRLAACRENPYAGMVFDDE